ncbi:MAG: hypothetical protein AAF587_34965 [Bacteroidota bacterium]
MDEHRQRQIDQYLEGELTGKDLAEFEQALANEPELEKELALQRDIEAAMREPEIADLEEKMANIISEEAGTVRQMLSPRWFMTIAAGLSLLVGLAWLIGSLGTSPHTPEEIYQSYINSSIDLTSFSATRSSVTNIRENDSLFKALQRIHAHYQAGAYQSALDVLDEHPVFLQIYPDLYYCYKGLFFLQVEQLDSASVTLERGMQGQGDFVESSTWYYTLLQLKKSGNTQKVRDRLEVFTSYDNDYREASINILKQLKTD